MPAFTLTATELRDWLAPAIACAGPNTDLPMLNAVLIERDGPTLTATATDRFRAGICLHQLSGKSRVKGRAVVRLDGLTRALAVLGPGRRRHDPRTITVDVRQGSVRLAGTLHNVDAEVAFDLPTAEALDRGTGTHRVGFPDVAKLVANACSTTSTPAATFGLNMALLKKFEAAVRGISYTDPVVFLPGAGPNKPVGVMVGDHFRGVIMPRRRLDQRDDGSFNGNAAEQAERDATAVTWARVLKTNAPDGVAA